MWNGHDVADEKMPNAAQKRYLRWVM